VPPPGPQDIGPTIEALQAAGATSLRAIADGPNAQGIPKARGQGTFTQNGMDGDRHTAAQYTMGQLFPSAAVRCERCDALKVIVQPINGKSPRALCCPKCNDLDPLQLPAIAGWMDGELRPPK
jgi:hypothetical protein